MLRTLKSQLGSQLLLLFLGTLVLSMVSLAYIAIEMVGDFGELSNSRNEANIRSHAYGFMARIAHEQALRYQSIFERFERSSAIIARQAASILDQEPAGESEFKRGISQLSYYPPNGIYSTDKQSTVMGLFWGGTDISPEIQQQINTISHIDPILQAVKEETPESTASYVVTEPGIARYYPNIYGVEKLPPVEEFDIRSANWYSIAKPEQNKEHRTKWTNIYNDSVGQGLLITASTPIYNRKGKYLGAAGVDITLETIVTDILGGIQTCDKIDKMFSFLTDDNGRLIAFPSDYLESFDMKIDHEKLADASVILKYSLLESSDPEIRKVGQAILEQPYQVSSFSLNGQPHLISSHNMPSTNWRLVIAVPESILLASVESTRDQLDSTVKQLTMKFVLLAALFLGVSIIAYGLFLIRNLIEPLMKLSAGISQLEGGDLTTQVKVNTRNEIGLFAETFNTMVSSLRNAKGREEEQTKRLEQRVEDRTEELKRKNDELQLTLEKLEQEIFERQKVQRELTESEETLRNIVENATNLFYSHTPSNEITYISPQSRQFLQCEPEEARIKWTEFATDHPCNVKAMQMTEKAIATGERQPPYELELQGVKGKKIMVEVREVPVVRDSRTVCMVGSLTDITKRKVAEEALIESESRYRSIFDFTPISIWQEDFSEVKKCIDELKDKGVTDLKSYLETNVDFTKSLVQKVKILDINPAALELFEAKERQELLGGLEKLFTEASMPAFVEVLIRLYTSHESKAVPFTVRTLKGNPLIARVSVVVVPGYETDWSRVLVSQVDITELLEAQRLAESANETKSIFLANMSHDLRTPLNGIMGMLQLLQASTLQPEQQRYLDMGMNSCRRLVGLLSDILDITKIEAGKLALASQSFNLDDVVQGVENMFSLAAADKHLQLVFVRNEDLPVCLYGDDHRLSQILMNLVSNAIKFSQEGEVKIELSAPHHFDDKIILLLTVSDSGVGIADEDIPILFELFTQVETTPSSQGTGLGLAIVKQLVLLMGGGICIECPEEGGTNFYLHLPFDCVEQPVDTGNLDNSLDERIPSISFRALVVEDDMISRLVLSSFLQTKGGEIDQAGSAEEGLEAIAENDYDIIFMDVQLPGIDGLEATRRLRNNPEFIAKATTPVIAMTATAMSGDREKCIAAGMNDYISKPVEGELLFLALEKYLGTVN